MDRMGEIKAVEDTLSLDPNLEGIPRANDGEANHINGSMTHVVPLEEVPKGIGIHHSMSDGSGGDTNGRKETISMSSLGEHKMADPI